MTNKRRTSIAALILTAASLTVSTSALADEWPFVSGDYWDVTGIDVKDGGSWQYANWLATEWRKDLEFAKSKGWIKDYMVFSNVYARKGEPDLYLVSIRESIPSGAEGEKRQQEYMEWQSKTIETMVKESGNRAEYREVGSDMLLQHMKFRD
ncbi:MAG: hypothetical protein JJ992_04995 [Planctomycetes bacterium]|nr:hypothetical protein [Planctomycetota bacterium]